MGMLATVMNGVALQNAAEQVGVDTLDFSDPNA